MSKKKRVARKGAIELSITTIIVVVMGITLLSLGLVFVRGLFGKLTQTTDDVFGKADTIIGALDIAGKFSAPSEIEVPQGSSKTFDIVVGHDGSLPGEATFDVRLTPVQDSNIDETKVKAKVISETPIKLKPGQQGQFVVQVVAVTDAPISLGGNTPAYSLTVTANGEQYATSAFLVAVTKPKGLFG